MISIMHNLTSRTVGHALAESNGIGPGFDLMRIGLALLILYGHCFLIAAGSGGHVADPAAAALAGLPAVGAANLDHSIWEGLHQLRLWLVLNRTDTHFYDMLVPMFFALSGFLVTGSAFRTKSIRTFFVFRALRILPALCTEVSLSALCLGPLLTSYTLKSYFFDTKFVAYFGNIIGLVKFELPGLFLLNPFPKVVNFNLWTLPGEFYCYLFIGMLILSGLLFSKKGFTFLFVLSSLVFLLLDHFYGQGDELHNKWLLVFYFFCGAFVYHWRDLIPLRLSIFLICAAYSYFHYLSPDFSTSITPFLLTYVTVYLGFLKFPRIGLIQSGDYSYGVYLYGFPISQALVDVVPRLQGHTLWLILSAVPITYGFAVFSWHVIEKPFLSLKRFFLTRSSEMKPETQRA